MFQIRQQQYDSMSQLALDDFERRVIAYLYQSHPECVVEAGEEAFESQVRASIQVAIENGIDLEVHVVQFVQLDLETAPRLEPDLDVKWNQILADQDLEQVHKIDHLRSLSFGLPVTSAMESDDDE